MWGPRKPALQQVPLSEGQIKQYAAHPRLDLFVDSNSPHSMEKFGCTTCHAGQGSATARDTVASPPGVGVSPSGRLRCWSDVPSAGRCRTARAKYRCPVDELRSYVEGLLWSDPPLDLRHVARLVMRGSKLVSFVGPATATQVVSLD